MKNLLTISLISGALIAGAASAADEDTKEQIKHEMTAGIPVAGALALQELRQSLASELPAGLPLAQQMDQLRAAFGAKKASDRI